MASTVSLGQVLFVDDEPLVLRAFERLLSDTDWTVDVASDVVTALTLAQQRSYTVVFADHHMPKMTGEQLIARMRPYQPTAACVVVTGHGDLAVAACKTPGLFAVLSKPWDEQAVLAILAACYRRRSRPAAPRVSR